MNNKISLDQVEAQYDSELFEQALKEEIKKAGGTKNIYKNPNFLQDIIKKSLESFLNAELDEHLGYEKTSKNLKILPIVVTEKIGKLSGVTLVK